MTQESGSLGSGDGRKLPYTAPRLTVFGNAVELTAAGTGQFCENGNGHAYVVGDCAGSNTVNNPAPDNPAFQRS